jgi:hypothetical protein
MGQHFVSDAATDDNLNGARLWSLISDLAKTVRLLDCDILTEEERTLVFDPQDPTYPMLARTLRTRRDNLKATIAMLDIKAGAPAIQSTV